MILLNIERPSALPAALAQVVAVAARAAGAEAHVAVVGSPAAQTAAINDIPRLQVQTQLAAYLVGGGFAGQGIDRDKSIMDGVSGVPPRGSPV